MTATVVPARSDVPREYTWDVASVFPSDEAWEEEVRGVLAALPDLDRFRGRLAEGPEVLAEFLRARERVERSLGKIQVYAIMRSAVDSGDQAAQALLDRAGGLSAQAGAALAFAEPELLAIGSETLREWAAAGGPLEVYAHWFDRLSRLARHVRSTEVEEVLGLAAEPLQSAAGIHGVLANAELVFQPAVGSDRERHEVTQGTYHTRLISHPDREVRRTAWTSYADAHLAAEKTMAACLTTGVKRDVFVARVRRYRDSLEAALTPNHIPTEVFHICLDAFRDNLGIWHRYWRLRRRALGVERLQEYDLRAPLAAPVEVPYAEAVRLISEGMAPLGEEYVSTLRRGVLEDRWVDVYPNRGKRQGAFSLGRPGTHPFIFTSYAPSLFGMSTLAHELGHSMHNYLTTRHQPFVYSRYGLFLAEVASNFNQALVRGHLLRAAAGRDFEIGVLEEAIGNFHRYFLVMPTLSRLELEIHRRIERGESLTADGLSELTADLFSEAYGDEVEVDRRRTGSIWAQFSTHLYSNFYCYQYATGIAAANALARRVLDGEPGAARDYLGFLSAGSSRYPLETLRLAGVDMTSREPIDSAFEVLSTYIERLERLLS
jgi:oligoendopeptidase F